MKKSGELYRDAHLASTVEESIRTTARSKREVATIASLLSSLAAHDDSARLRIMKFTISHFNLYLGNN